MDLLPLVVIGAVLVGMPAGVAVAFHYWGRWIRRRRPGPASRRLSWLPMAAIVSQALAHLWAVVILAPAIAEASRSTSALDKAKLLSNALFEAMNCDTFAQLPGILLLVVSGVAFAILSALGPGGRGGEWRADRLWAWHWGLT